MLKTCEYCVDKLFKGFGKVCVLSPSSTNIQKYLTSQVFFVLNFYTIHAHISGIFKQLKSSVNDLFFAILPTYYTPPTNEAKLIN